MWDLPHPGPVNVPPERRAAHDALDMFTRRMETHADVLAQVVADVMGAVRRQRENEHREYGPRIADALAHQGDDPNLWHRYHEALSRLDGMLAPFTASGLHDLRESIERENS